MHLLLTLCRHVTIFSCTNWVYKSIILFELKNIQLKLLVLNQVSSQS